LAPVIEEWSCVGLDSKIYYAPNDYPMIATVVDLVEHTIQKRVHVIKQG
jgi:hypothetical protein